MKILKNIAILSGVIIISGVFINAASTHSMDSVKMESKFPTTIDFAGEAVPLHITDVRERLDRELTVNQNLHASTELIFKRAGRAFPIIEPILKKHGVPDDFKYLAVAESALMNATSSAGAKGVWQFMPATAKEKGMIVNDEVDERYHLEKSTEAACKYLIEVKNKLGSWTLAAAAYNGGLAGVNRQITFQGENNYYNLLLTDETHRYVFRILALKEIMQNPVKYGYNISNEELYKEIPFKKIQVDSTITNLSEFAKQQGINYKILKIHNPWLRDRKLTNTSKLVYEIEIPTAGY